MSSYTIFRYSGEVLPFEFRNFVLANWLRSFRRGNDYMKLTDTVSYYAMYQLYIYKILDLPETSVRIASLTDDPDIALGFSVSRGNILDFVFVRKENRKFGIGKSLIPEGINTITHLTRTGMSIWNNKYPSWKFNLFA